MSVKPVPLYVWIGPSFSMAPSFCVFLCCCCCCFSFGVVFFCVCAVTRWKSWYWNTSSRVCSDSTCRNQASDKFSSTFCIGADLVLALPELEIELTHHCQRNVICTWKFRRCFRLMICIAELFYTLSWVVKPGKYILQCWLIHGRNWTGMLISVPAEMCIMHNLKTVCLCVPTPQSL